MDTSDKIIHLRNEHKLTSGIQQMLVVVLNQHVVSIFPSTQSIAAINLGRVLCRALDKPVDIYRLPYNDNDSVRSGIIVHSQHPDWYPLAHVRKSESFSVAVELVDA